jgi:hypothetical protein
MMTDANPTPDAGRTLADVGRAADLGEDELTLVTEAADGPAAVHALLDGGHPAGAVSLLAHALPRREAVFWAFTCAREAEGEGASDEARQALEATKTWIADPTDEHRRAAFAAAQTAGVETPAGCVGAAAYFCGDTLGPADQPPVAPGEFMAAKAIAAAVTLSALAGSPEDPLARFRALADEGLVVARKAGLWAPSPEEA